MPRGVQPEMKRRGLLLGAAGALIGCAGSGSTDPSSRPLAKRGIAKAVNPVAKGTRLPFEPEALKKTRELLLPLHPRTGSPQPGDWLADHPEPGQTFDQYLAANPTRPTEERNTIVVMPLGVLPAGKAKIVELTTEYLRRHFGLPARLAEPFALEPPAWARRKKFGSEQFLTRYILDKVLPAQLPKDAAALIGFTSNDLWPGEGWNFVFGEATLEKRVGVWSLHRYGDPDEGPAAFTLALRRALKVAVHETGHMFSLEHCTRYPCVQAGTNSIDETDKSPLWLCPDCLPKIAWAISTDPKERLRQTSEFCKSHELAEEHAFLERSLAALA